MGKLLRLGAISFTLTAMNRFSPKLLLILLTFSASSANASQCIGHSDIWDYVKEAEYIFSAMVISITSDDLERRPIMEAKTFESPIRLKMGFDPFQVIRGDIDELENLVTWQPGGMNFAVGQQYYFFVKRNGEVNRCSATYELEQMAPAERTDFLEQLGFISIEHAEQARQWDAYHRWELDLWSELNATNQPWVWALYLHNLERLAFGKRVEKSEVKGPIDKLLSHPAPGADALYWAVLFCSARSGFDRVCRMPELNEALLEDDPDNLYVFGLYFTSELAAKSGIGETSSEHWDWSYFDAWLNQALAIRRAEDYRFQHFSELVELLIGYGKRNGFYTNLKYAPLEWRAVNYVMDELVYPHYGPTGFFGHCQMSAYLGRTNAALSCRKLANRLLEGSKTFDGKSAALSLMSLTYSKDEPEFIRLLREGAAWNVLVKECVNRIQEYQDPNWSIDSDVETFLNDFEKNGEIIAFQNLAQAEGWRYKDASGAEFECTKLPDLSDSELAKMLGPQDPARFHCREGDACYPGEESEATKQKDSNQLS